MQLFNSTLTNFVVQTVIVTVIITIFIKIIYTKRQSNSLQRMVGNKKNASSQNIKCHKLRKTKDK